MSTVTIAIQSYRNPEMLRVCLNAVHKYAGTHCEEIIVADGGTEEDTALMMREEYADVIFLPHQDNVGFGVLVNACLAQAHGTYIFFINADTILTEGVVDTLRLFMQTYQDVGLCGPAQKNFNGTWENTRFRFYKPQTILYRRTPLRRLRFAQRHLALFEMHDVTDHQPYTVPWVIGSAMFVRRAAINEIGGMDARFFMYMEDADWCRRLWDAGWKVVYHPGCSIFHFYGKGSARGGVVKSLLVNRLTWIHLASGLKYFMKYRGKALPHIRTITQSS